MPRFINTTGRQHIAVAICARCGMKHAYDDLESDPNFPGLRVCKDDRDVFDPYRLPARVTENIALEYPRPDVGISDSGPTPLYGTQQLNPVVGGRSAVNDAPITALGAPRVWQPRTFYRKGDTIVPNDPNADTTVLPQPQFVVLEDGWSGDVAPVWPVHAGVVFEERP